VVGPQADLRVDSLIASDLNWLAGEAPPGPFQAQVKTRYSAVERPATITPFDAGRRVRVVLEEKQAAATPGQAAVFYVEDEVIGGGIIQ
jgi:tRNA-specific 2-thiouridylase